MQRRHRLKKSAEFQRVRALKQSWAHPLLVLYVAPNGLELTRVGISTSKRIGKAVTRNRVKRLIREAARRFLPSLPKGRDLVFIARPATAEAGYEQISQAMEILLRRARLLPQRQPAVRERDQTAREAGSESIPTVDAAVDSQERDRARDEVDRVVSD